VTHINILHRHLYRDPEDKDANTPAFSFQMCDIMTVIHRHESLQKASDTKPKRRLEEALEALKKREARKAKRQGKA